MVIKSYQENYGGYDIMNMPTEKNNVTAKVKFEEAKIVDTYNGSANTTKESAVVNLPTKGYIDKVIAQAVANIKNGENVSENRRILNIFSNITGENPITTELKAYI